mmetsp:Transcript_38537/g.90995  ORF Transcript_38537/g.90995 Transcript_38537/m.90995 type:complete len:517 (+) Transcript_38537:141-1691(+)
MDQAEAMDKMLDEAEPVEVWDQAQLKRAVVSLIRKTATNQEMRIKHPDEPARFLDSEVELFEEINKMQALATSPELYTEFVKLNGVAKMTELLDHENKDIALAVVDLANELTDPEALIEAASEEGSRALVDALVENSFLELLIKNLQRLDESEDDQKQGVYSTLGIVENLSEVQPGALDAMCEKSDLIPWLLKRLTVKGIDGNKLYASEILSIVCQSSDGNKKRVAGGEGIDKLLALVAPWKKKDPKDSEEAELISNLFNTICSTLMITENQVALVEGEGIELMVIMLQARKFAARCALRVLDFAMMRQTSACERFVKAMGLKTLFPAFMRPSSVWQTKSPEGKVGVREDEEHVVSIIATLLLRLSGDAHARTVGKFVENNFEKLDRLVELHEKYHKQVSAAVAREEDEEEEEDESEEGKQERQYLLRLDRGLFTLQHIDTTLAYLIAEAIPAIEGRIKTLLHQSDVSIAEVVTVMEEFQTNIGDDKDGTSDPLKMKEVAGDLILFLKDYAAQPEQ